MSEYLFDPDVYTTLGKQGAEIAHVRETCDRLESTCLAMAQNIEALLADKNQREGSRKTVYAIAAGIASAAGAAASAAVAFLKHG